MEMSPGAWIALAALTVTVLGIGGGAYLKHDRAITRLIAQFDVMWSERESVGKAALQRRGMLEENSPVTLVEAVMEAMDKGIPPDMMEAFRELSKMRLPKHNAEVWGLVVKRVGMDRLVARAQELEWEFDELKYFWVLGLRDPSLVERIMRGGGS